MKLSEIPYKPQPVNDNELHIYARQCCELKSDMEINCPFTNPVIAKKETFSANYGFGMKREDMKGVPYTHNYLIVEDKLI